MTGLKRAERAVWWLIACVAVLTLLTWGMDYVGRGDNVQTQRTGCLRSTLERLATATKDAADSLRERALANTPGESHHLEHAASAEASETAARVILSVSGVPETLPLDEVAAMDPRDPELKAERVVFCRRVFPSAPVVPLP